MRYRAPRLLLPASLNPGGANQGSEGQSSSLLPKYEKKHFYIILGLRGASPLSALILSIFLHAITLTVLILLLTPSYKNLTHKFITVRIFSENIAQEQTSTNTLAFPSPGGGSGGNSNEFSRVVKAPDSPGLTRREDKGISPGGLVEGLSKFYYKEVPYRDIVEEALHAIKAKKRVERIARLRAEIRKTHNQETRIPPIETSTEAQRLEPVLEQRSTYEVIVENIIASNWSYPEVAKKGLSASVLVSVQKDGSIKIIEFKSSGDRLFDYSVKNALLKSSPLPRPPEAVEIEMRFSE